MSVYAVSDCASVVPDDTNALASYQENRGCLRGCLRSCLCAALTATCHLCLCAVALTAVVACIYIVFRYL